VAIEDDQAIKFVRPEWNAPACVQAVATCRYGGVSTAGYQSLNLATHVDDDPQCVRQNRQRLEAALQLPQAPRWISQVHSADIVCADDVPIHAEVNATALVAADGAWTNRPGTVCAVLTADCLPVLMCDAAGTRVAAVHAGWRGLAAGILDAALDAFFRAGTSAEQISIWLGPAIGPGAYEVDAVVRDALLQREPECQAGFTATRPGHWNFNLNMAASAILGARGIREISSADVCTYSDERFYSYRRDHLCGRQASLIWLDTPKDEM
jgi:YfiH family protein